MQKNTYESIEKTVLELNNKIKNIEICELIFDKINIFLDEKHKKLYIDNNKIIGKTIFKKDAFILTYNNDEVDFTEIMYEGRSTHNLNIKFDGEEIIVENKEIHKIVKENTNELCELQKKNNTKKYISNELRYEKEEENDLYINNQMSYFKVNELYINEEKQAFLKEIIVGEEKSFYDTKISYLKSDTYKAVPFNTKIENGGLYMCGMSHSTKEEFEEFKKTETKKIKMI